MTKKLLKGPFIKSSSSSEKIMKSIIITLIPLIIFTFIHESLLPYLNSKVDLHQMLSPILTIITTTITIIITEYIYHLISHRQSNSSSPIKDPQNIIMGLILGLIIPNTVPLYLIIIASIIASITKSLSHTFHHYLFNPIIVGMIPIIILTNNQVAETSNIEVASIILSIIYLIIFIYLCYKQAIKWQISLSYIITIILAITFITITNHLSITYIIYHIISGSLIFSAIFLATDSLTSPTTKYGRVIYGISLGIITLILYYLIPFTNLLSSPLIAIFIMNLLVKPIDKLAIQINFNRPCQRASIAIIVIIAIIVASIISYQL